jgi:hypothetical protein
MKLAEDHICMYADSAHLSMDVFVRARAREGMLLQLFDDRLGILGSLASMYYGFFFVM